MTDRKDIYVKCDVCGLSGLSASCDPSCVNSEHMGCDGLSWGPAGHYVEITYKDAFILAKTLYDDSLSMGYECFQALDYVEDMYGENIRENVEKYIKGQMHRFFT